MLPSKFLQRKILFGKVVYVGDVRSLWIITFPYQFSPRTHHLIGVNISCVGSTGFTSHTALLASKLCSAYYFGGRIWGLLAISTRLIQKPHHTFDPGFEEKNWKLDQSPKWPIPYMISEAHLPTVRTAITFWLCRYGEYQGRVRADRISTHRHAYPGGDQQRDQWRPSERDGG